MLSFRVNVVQQQTQTLPIQHRAHRCVTVNMRLMSKIYRWGNQFKYQDRHKVILTLKSVFKEFLGKIGGPFFLSTSINLFVNSGDKILAHLIQQGHKVFQHLWRNHLLVENNTVWFPVFAVPVERSEGCVSALSLLSYRKALNQETQGYGDKEKTRNK